VSKSRGEKKTDMGEITLRDCIVEVVIRVLR